MARALFFDQTYFYENTAVDENTNWKGIRPVLWDCMEIYIQDIVGTQLYEELKDQVVNNTETALNQDLLDNYIAPCLLNYTMMEAQVTMLYKFRNRSVAKDRSDYSNPVDFKEHRYLKDQYQIKAEKYARKIQDFLIANIDDYPLYLSFTESDDVVAQNQSPQVSLYLGGGKRNCPTYGRDE